MPREVAAWLAPLVDAGKIRLEGVIRGEGDDLPAPERTEELPGLWETERLEVRVVLREAGREILERNPAPATADEAFHEIVRDAWKRSGTLKDPEIAGALGLRLSAMAAEDVPPETRLLLALLPGRGQFVRDRMARGFVLTLKTILAQLETMPPVSCDGLVCLPFASVRARPGRAVAEFSSRGTSCCGVETLRRTHPPGGNPVSDRVDSDRCKDYSAGTTLQDRGHDRPDCGGPGGGAGERLGEQVALAKLEAAERALAAARR